MASVARGPERLTAAAAEFLAERHLATFTTVRGDGSPHVVPVGFTWDRHAGLARVITDGASVKARLAAAGGPVALCQVDGARWLTLLGRAVVSREPDRVADAVARYAVRYRAPRVNPNRVVIEITVDAVLGPATLTAAP
jgi:PPOX class probable F420-dependent enzyme